MELYLVEFKDGIKWKLGSKLSANTIEILEYNLSFNSLDVYLDDGRLVRVFDDIRYLFYRPKENAEEKNL